MKRRITTNPGGWMRTRGWCPKRLPTLLAVMMSVAAGAAPAALPAYLAQARVAPPPAARARPQPLSRDQAVAVVQKRYRARVVRADTREEDGQRYYVLRLLSEGGKVWTVRVDAQTGQVR